MFINTTHEHINFISYRKMNPNQKQLQSHHKKRLLPLKPPPPAEATPPEDRPPALTPPPDPAASYDDNMYSVAGETDNIYRIPTSNKAVDSKIPASAEVLYKVGSQFFQVFEHS